MLSFVAFSSVSAQGGAATPMRGVIDLVIGGTDEVREDYEFGSISETYLDGAGRIYVADGKFNTLRVFDQAGKLLHNVGRKGAGPGDLNMPCCLNVDRAGLLWVGDNGNKRYSVYSITGIKPEFVKNVPTPYPNAYRRVEWTRAGELIFVTETNAPLNKSHVRRSFLDSAGRIIREDSILRPPDDSLPMATLSKPIPNTSGAVASVGFGQPYGPQTLRAHGPGGQYATGVSSRYAITWIDERGNRVLIKRNLLGPVVTAAQRDSAEAGFERQAANMGKTRADIPFDVPARAAPLRNIEFDLDGRLWIHRTVPDSTPNIADVFERGGKHVMTVEWPANVARWSSTVRGTTMLGARTDSLGSQQLVRMKLVRR